MNNDDFYGDNYDDPSYLDGGDDDDLDGLDDLVLPEEDIQGMQISDGEGEAEPTAEQNETEDEE